MGKNFIKYYDKYKNKIYNYFFYRVGFNREIAEDLTQEAFIKVYENMDGFDETRPFQAWIYKISKNHLSNFYRTNGREVSLECGEKAAYDIKKVIEAEFELDRIFKIIGEMENYHKDVLFMRFVDGLDNNEIAEILEKDEGAVRAQISRALKELRSLIKEENG